jgi:phosphate transport system substrate-binding protein
MRLSRALLATMFAGAVALVAAPAMAQQDITGAGATFPAPVYSAWGEAAKAATGVQLNYQAIGSGGGQNQILNRTVDFGASDAPMDPSKLDSGKLLQFPTVMGAVVPIVNIPGVEPNQLKLTGELLADIYAGKIAKWNDTRIAELNNGLKLPSLAIAPAYRADGSGTTYVFTSYLSTVSSGWKSSVGASTSVKWPAGNGAKGNDGVAALVKQVKGAVGYVEYIYAHKNNLTTALLQNKSGKFPEPSLAAFQAAAASADWAGAKNYAVNLIDVGGDATWPIVSATFIELPKDPKDAARSAAVMKFFDWAYANGNDLASKLDYVALPQAVQDAVRAAWRSEIKDSDGNAIYK